MLKFINNEESNWKTFEILNIDIKNKSQNFIIRVKWKQKYFKTQRPISKYPDVES